MQAFHPDFPQDAIKLLVVEDHPVYLEGLSYILKNLDDNLDLTRVYSTREALDLLSESANFDLALVDLCLPDGGGLSILQYLTEHKLFIPAVILSASEEPKDVYRAKVAGASGFISKASNSDLIVQAIRKILNGDHYWPEFFSERTFDALSERFSERQAERSAERPSLTPRQLEVLQLVAEGLPNKRICQLLNVSEHTVKSYMKLLFSELNVHNRTECARVAIELGLLES